MPPGSRRQSLFSSSIGGTDRDRLPYEPRSPTRSAARQSRGHLRYAPRGSPTRSSSSYSCRAYKIRARRNLTLLFGVARPIDVVIRSLENIARISSRRRGDTRRHTCAMRPKGNHEPHPALVWRPALTAGFELTIPGFQKPLGRAVPLSNGRWRTVVRAPGRAVRGATAANLNQARLWLTKWATPIAWRHRPTVSHAGSFRSAP